MDTIFRILWYTIFVSALVALFGCVMAKYLFKVKKLFPGINICTQLAHGALTLIFSFVIAAHLPFFDGNNWRA